MSNYLNRTLLNRFSTIMQFQRDKDEIRRELEKQMRDNHLNNMLKQEEIRSLEERVRELGDKLAKKKEKGKDLKSVRQSLEFLY